MPKFILIKIFCILPILLFVNSCTYIKRHFFHLTPEELNLIEREDHNFCTNLGLDFSEDELKNELYWRCRIIRIQNNFKSSIRTGSDSNSATNYKQLIANVNRDFRNAYENWQIKRNDFFDNAQHKYCLNQGFDIETLDQTKIEDYLVCRKRLIDNEQIIPPYQNTQYFNRPRNSYNTTFAINKRLDKEIAKFESEKAKYPKCIKFNIRSDEFKDCSNDYNKKNQCLEKIPSSKSSFELQKKIFCQKETYIRFPDSMIKKDLEKERERNDLKSRTDTYGKNNFFAIGINKTNIKKFEGENSEKINDTEDNKQKTKNKKLDKNFNKNDELYDKNEITKLRQKFITSCQESTNPEIEKYQEELQNKCMLIVEKWENNE